MDVLRRSFAVLGIASTSFARPSQLHTSAVLNSVFMKKQKKMDPEVAKAREARKRKKLEREIRMMQKHSKKPKPVDEMSIDVQSAKNLHERHRPVVEVSEAELDERALALKAYAKSRAQLQQKDDAWLRAVLNSQDEALRELKQLSPQLYEAAIQVEDAESGALPFVVRGPSLTPPVRDYFPPDGDYIDTTRTFT